jgi:hypothetical protein
MFALEQNFWNAFSEDFLVKIWKKIGKYVPKFLFNAIFKKKCILKL